jgi:hypothetical protein
MARVPAGFSFVEVLGGTYALVSAPDHHRRLTLSLKVRIPSVLRHFRDGRAELAGTLEMDGFATEAPIRGWLTAAPLRRRMAYALEFVGNDAQRYHLGGEKSINFRMLRDSLTTFPATVTALDGKEVARATARFDARADLFEFIASVRPE